MGRISNDEGTPVAMPAVHTQFPGNIAIPANTSIIQLQPIQSSPANPITTLASSLARGTTLQKGYNILVLNKALAMNLNRSEIAENSPNLNTNSPSMNKAEDQNSTAPGTTQQKVLVLNKALVMNLNTSEIAENSPNLNTNLPNLNTTSPNENTNSPNLNTKSPNLNTISQTMYKTEDHNYSKALYPLVVIKEEAVEQMEFEEHFVELNASAADNGNRLEDNFNQTSPNAMEYDQNETEVDPLSIESYPSTSEDDTKGLENIENNGSILEYETSLCFEEIKIEPPGSTSEDENELKEDENELKETENARTLKAENKFKCHLCDYVAEYKCHLNIHIKRVHGKGKIAVP